jgi:hypothetical protein
MWQGVIVTALLAAAFIAGLVHWAVVAVASRRRKGSGLTDRLAPFGLGGWHIGVLRRSWYPPEALPLRRWVVLTYIVNMAALVIAAALLIAWVIL